MKERKKNFKLIRYGILLILVIVLAVGCANEAAETVSTNELNDPSLTASEIDLSSVTVEEIVTASAAEQILAAQDLSEISFDAKWTFQKDYPVILNGQKVTLSITLERKMIDLIIDELIANNGLKNTSENRAKFEEKALEIHLGNQAVYAETDYMRTAPVPAMDRDEFVHRLTTYAGIYQGRVADKEHCNEVTDEEFAWAVDQIIAVVEKYLALVDTTTNYDALYEAYSEERSEVKERLQEYL